MVWTLKHCKISLNKELFELISQDLRNFKPIASYRTRMTLSLDLITQLLNKDGFLLRLSKLFCPNNTSFKSPWSENTRISANKFPQSTKFKRSDRNKIACKVSLARVYKLAKFPLLVLTFPQILFKNISNMIANLMGNVFCKNKRRKSRKKAKNHLRAVNSSLLLPFAVKLLLCMEAPKTESIICSIWYRTNQEFHVKRFISCSKVVFWINIELCNKLESQLTQLLLFC